MAAEMRVSLKMDRGYVCTKTLPITEILMFVDATDASRNLCEGERILDAGHVIMCGISNETEEEISIFALCLSTSALSGDPHTLKATLSKTVDDAAVKVKTASCSCKAGLSENCKHTVAVLLKCNRQGIYNLERLSATDLECSWKSSKKPKNTYEEVTPLAQYCHVEQPPKPFLLAADKEARVFEEILQLCPDSAVSMHRSRRRKEQFSSGVSLAKQDSEWAALISSAEASTVLEDLATQQLPFTVSTHHMNFYETNIRVTKEEACKLLRDSYDDKLLWTTQRRNRITGTTCYPLFTYSKKDWPKKVLSTLHSSFSGNSATRYGKNNEEAARLKYEEVTQNKVVTCGLVVSTKSPWLACSPDGVVIKGGSPHILVEIKCPVKGKGMCATEVASTCNFLTKDGERYCLKRRHTYFAQVQLGMAILNVNQCDFVVYAAFDSSVHIIPVKFDYEFLWNMVSRLKQVYFEHVLPALCA